MKKILHILILCLPFYLAGQVKIVEVLPACKNLCNGSVTIEAQGVKGMKFIVELSGVAPTRVKIEGKHRFTNLCPGNYTIQVFPENFPTCGQQTLNVEVKESSGFELIVKNFCIRDCGPQFKSLFEVMPSVSGDYEYKWEEVVLNSGSISVRYVFPETGNKLVIPYGFNYSGTIRVTVNEKRGCGQVVKVFNICADAGTARSYVFERHPDYSTDKPIVQAKQKQPSEFLTHTIKWYGKNNRVVGTSDVFEPNIADAYDSPLGRYIIGEATTCTDRVEPLQVRGIVFLDCATPSPAELRSLFKSNIIPACPEFSGYVGFEIHDFLNTLYPVGIGQGWQLAPKVTIDGVSLNFPNNDFSYAEGSPVSPGIHYIKIEIGGCVFEFDVNVHENPTILRFAGTNTNGENPSMCIYKRTCPGQGERDIVVPPFFDLSKTNTCVFPGFCEFEGLRAQVGNLVLGTKMLPAEMYRLLVKSEMDDTQDPVKRKLLGDQLALATNLPNCSRVRFCEKTLVFQGHDPARWFIGNDNGEVFCEGTCTLVKCVDPLIGILGRISSSCDHAPKHVPDGENCCPPGGKMVDVNLAQMAINYAQLTPDGLQEVYEANSNFENSELEQILKHHIIPLFGTNPTKQSIIDKITQDFGDPRLKKLRCAKVTVCDNEFKLKGIERASNGSLPNPLDLVDDCGDNVISVPLDKFGKPSSDKFRRSFRVDLCEFHPDFLRDNPVPSESANGLIGVFPCGKKEEKIGFFRVKKEVSDRIVRLFANTTFFSSEDVLIERKIISEQGLTPQDSVVDSVFFDYKIKLQFDTIQPQTFQSLSTINSQGEIRPDLLFSQNDSIKLYNYGHHLPSVFSLDRQNHLFTHEDWDEDRNYSILKSIPKKEVLLSIQDTSILAVTAISTDSLIKVQHFSKVDSSVYIAGHYFGHLYIGGRVFDSLPDYSRAKVFFIRFSKNGRLLDVATAGPLDTLSGIRFSENKHGVINWAAQALGDSVNVDTSVLGLSASNALLLGQYSITQGLRILNHSQGHDAFRIANVALSPALQETAIALVGVGAVGNTNGKPQLSSGSSLQVLRFNGQGTYFDALSCSLQNLNQQKIALTYGAENALALGLNYQSTINVFDTTLTSAGFEDFAIFKFKPNGDLHWVHDNGSLDQESINQLWYDNRNVLYFGGEMSGNLAETHTYGIYVFYDTTALGTQRVFLSAVLDTFYQTGTTQFSELASINQPVVDIKKALPISFKAYPNPFQNQITAEFILDTPGEITLQLFNQLGNVVEVRKINANDGLNREQISTNSLPSGLYFLHLHDAQNRQIGVQKVLKM